MYTARLEGALYVLHVFQKKSKRGIATPKTDLDRVKSRYELARQHHAPHYQTYCRAAEDPVTTPGDDANTCQPRGTGRANPLHPALFVRRIVDLLDPP